MYHFFSSLASTYLSFCIFYFHSVVCWDGKFQYFIGSFFRWWLSLGLVVWPRLGDPVVSQNPIFQDGFWWYSYHLFVNFSWVFHNSISWWSFPGVWVTTFLLLTSCRSQQCCRLDGFDSPTYFLFLQSHLQCSNYNCYYYYYYHLLIRVFHISVSRWSFTGVWVRASLLKSPGLFSVF